LIDERASARDVIFSRNSAPISSILAGTTVAILTTVEAASVLLLGACQMPWSLIGKTPPGSFLIEIKAPRELCFRRGLRRDRNMARTTVAMALQDSPEGNDLSQVEEDLYGGPEGRLWELVAGEMLHCGGLDQTVTMAKKAGIAKGDKVLDLCSGFGSSLRFLAKNFKIEGYGLDISPYMVAEATKRTRAEGLDGQIAYKQGSVYQVPWPDNTFDAVWGEDAWCYLESKESLIKEAARAVKPGGRIAFSDWMTGPSGLSPQEAERIHTFLKFPYTESLNSYESLLQKYGMRIRSSEDLCKQFAVSMDLYLRMIKEQLTYDALRILGDDSDLFDHVCEKWNYLIEMSRKGKFGQGRIVAVKL
jgi:sarcosine/dimethylglycine N-methyltransferase